MCNLLLIALCSRRSKVVFWFWTFELVSSVVQKSLSSAQSLMQQKNVADSVSGFLFSFQLKLSLLFLFDKFLVVWKKKSCRRSFGSSFAWNTNSFWYNKVNFRNKLRQRKPKSSSVGFEPATSGLEVKRSIHCTTRTSGLREYNLQSISGIGMKALCTCFSFLTWLIQTDRIKTTYQFWSLRFLARRLCPAVVNPVVLLAVELQVSLLDLLCLMFFFLF